MGIFKKIWHWLFDKKEVESYEDIKAKCLKDAPVTYNTGGYTGDVDYSKASKIRREGDKDKRWS